MEIWSCVLRKLRVDMRVIACAAKSCLGVRASVAFALRPHARIVPSLLCISIISITICMVCNMLWRVLRALRYVLRSAFSDACP